MLSWHSDSIHSLPSFLYPNSIHIHCLCSRWLWILRKERPPPQIHRKITSRHLPCIYRNAFHYPHEPSDVRASVGNWQSVLDNLPIDRDTVDYQWWRSTSPPWKSIGCRMVAVLWHINCSLRTSPYSRCLTSVIISISTFFYEFPSSSACLWSIKWTLLYPSYKPSLHTAIPLLLVTIILTPSSSHHHYQQLARLYGSND